MGPNVDQFTRDRKPTAVRVFDATKLVELPPLKFPAPPPGRSGTTDPLEQLELRKKAYETNLTRAQQTLAAHDTAVIDARIVDLEEAIKIPGLNETAKEVLTREIKNDQASRERSIQKFIRYSKSMKTTEASIKQIEEQIAAIKRERLAKEKSKASQNLSPLLGLNLMGEGNRLTIYYNSDRSGFTHMVVSPNGRYVLFRWHRKIIKFLIDQNSLIPVDMGPGVGRENFSYSADGQFVESPGTDGEGYRMNSYLTTDLNYRAAIHNTGAYPRACAHDPVWPFFYAQKFDKNLLIYNEWSGSPLKELSLSRRGDEVAKYFPLAKGGDVYVALETGIYHASIHVKPGLFTRDWKITSLPEMIAKASKPYTYKLVVKNPLARASFQLQQAPEGMAFDAARGMVVWTPKPTQIGRHKALLVATTKNDADAQIRQSLVINVIK